VLFTHVARRRARAASARDDNPVLARVQALASLDPFGAAALTRSARRVRWRLLGRSLRLGTKDILRFCEDSRSDERRERLRRHELHSSSKTVFEELRKDEEVLVRLGTGRKLHEQIDITVWAGVAAQNRPEQRKPPHPKGPNLGL